MQEKNTSRATYFVLHRFFCPTFPPPFHTFSPLLFPPGFTHPRFLFLFVNRAHSLREHRLSLFLLLSFTCFPLDTPRSTDPLDDALSVPEKCRSKPIFCVCAICGGSSPQIAIASLCCSLRAQSDMNSYAQNQGAALSPPTPTPTPSSPCAVCVSAVCFLVLCCFVSAHAHTASSHPPHQLPSTPSPPIPPKKS